MGAAYTIMGKLVPAQYISLATLGVTLLVALPNPFSSSTKEQLKINASSPEEEKFILDYLKKAEEKH